MSKKHPSPNSDNDRNIEMPVDSIIPRSHVILYGENEEDYNRISKKIAESVNPDDIFEHIWARDITDHVWEIIRLRRLKGDLIQGLVSIALKQALFNVFNVGEVDKLISRYTCGETDARKEVERRIGDMAMSISSIQAQVLRANLPDIERIERLIASAESRRNTVLREISRRRDVLAARLALAGAVIEDGQFTESKSASNFMLPLHGKQT